MEVPRSFRLALFLERMAALPHATTLAEARGQLDVTLNAVEDEFSGVRLIRPNGQWMVVCTHRRTTLPFQSKGTRRSRSFAPGSIGSMFEAMAPSGSRRAGVSFF